MLKPPECEGCPAYNNIGFTIPEGDGEIAICGESPGHDEYIDGLPFRPHAEAGSVLERAIRKLGIHRNYFRIYNVIQCHPKGNELPKVEAIDFCQKHRDKVFNGSKVVIALGDLAMRVMAPKVPTGFTLSQARGFVYDGVYGPTIPTFHPSFLRRGNMHLMPILIKDIALALHVYHNGRPFLENEPNFILNPSIDDLRSIYYKLKSNSSARIAIDVETEGCVYVDEDKKEKFGALKSVQLSSIGLFDGVFIPFIPEFTGIIQDILLLPNPKWGHNIWLFDQKVLQSNNFKIADPIHDLMWLYKHCHPELPRSLQSVAAWYWFPFPWKHLSPLELYGCWDTYVLSWLIPRVLEDARHVIGDNKRGYLGQVYLVHPIIQRMADRGLPVDPDAIQKLESGINAELEDVSRKVDDSVPIELHDKSPSRTKDGITSYGYVRPPAIVKLYLHRFGNESEAYEALWKDHRLKLVDGKWCKIKPFKPSKQQVIRYLEWKQKQAKTKVEFSNYRTPKRKRKHAPGHVETTASKELELISDRTGDEVISGIVRYRSLKKLLTNDIPNWRPHPDGRVHSTFGYVAPTGQLNASRPNILNASKHSELGQIFRRVIVAPKGYKFLEFDYQRLHVVTMGFEAEDPDYVKFGKLDSHSIFTSYVFPGVTPIDLNWSDSDIKEAVREYRKIPEFEKLRNDQCKHTVLANNNGASPRKLYEMTRPGIPDIQTAERLQRVLAERFPKTEKYKRDITRLAHEQGYLLNRWLYLREFSDVFTPKIDRETRSWVWVPGTDWNKALSFNLQSTAFGFMKEKLKLIAELGYDETFNLVNTIHDSFVFMPHEQYVELAIESILSVLKAPCEFLTNMAAPGGLSVGVSYAVGRNMAAFSEDNPDGMREF